MARKLVDDARKIRTLIYDRDADTDARAIMDIVEFDVPGACHAPSWTALSRDSDAAKRALLIHLSRQIDALAAGHVDEIVVVLA